MSQQAIAHDRNQDLSTPSNQQQPGRLVGRKPVGIEAGVAAVVLAALCLSLTLLYGVESAVCTKQGYAAISLKREIEDLRAENELLSYQINQSQSGYHVEQTAARLQMQAADPLKQVDYIVLSPSARDRVTLAELDPVASRHGVSGVLTALAEEVVGSTRNHAEASTGVSHRP